MSTLRAIGYWQTIDEPNLPDPHALIDERMTPAEREALVTYLSTGIRGPYACMGYSNCRICGALNGSAEYTDGVFIWPEGLPHYVSAHSVRLPIEVYSRAEASEPPAEVLGDVEVDLSWWQSVTSG